MNKKILENATEDFVLKYRAAVKAKLSREQFALYLNIKPKSVLRRKQAIATAIGLDLPILPSGSEVMDKKTLTHFETIVSAMADHILKSEKINASDVKVSIEKNKRYVITSAQNATQIHEGFLKSLQHYCSVNDAELIVIPYRYKNPNSIWSSGDRGAEWWHKSLIPYLVCDERKVGKHIRLMGNIKIQPTAVSPLSGFDTVTGLDSAIFGHPTVEMKTIASVPGKMPKIMVTTGSITLPNYTDSKAGHKGAFHHTYSAVVLEIDEDELFHIRHVTANEKGNFYDLDKYYSHNSTLTTTAHGALALVAGDIHAEFVSDDAVYGLFTGPDSVASVLNPKVFVLHDLIDASSRSHHNIRDALGRYKKHLFNDNNNVEESLQKVANFLELISRDDTTNYVVKSNHDEHIERWLKEADPNIDPENAKFYHYIKYHQYKAVYENRDFDVIKFWCRNPDEYQGLDEDVYERTKFLTRDEGLEIGGVELSMHGDIGPNGSRGSLKNLARMGQRLIIGHSHTPGICNGSYQVGTTSNLRLEYVRGPSSWLNTAAIIYPDGSVTLINVINGKWKI